MLTNLGVFGYKMRSMFSRISRRFEAICDDVYYSYVSCASTENIKTQASSVSKSTLRHYNSIVKLYGKARKT